MKFPIRRSALTSSNLPNSEKPSTLDLSAIDAGVAIVEDVSKPDSRDALERKAVELEASRLNNDYMRARIKSAKADRRMREKYAGRILGYLELYSLFVGFLLLLSGYKVNGFSLPPEILAALVGTTAVAAIGLVGFIARGLFQPPPAA